MATAPKPLAPPALLDDPSLRTVELPNGVIAYMVDDLLRLVGLHGVERDVENGFYPDIKPAYTLRLPDLQSDLISGCFRFVGQQAALAVIYCGRTEAAREFRDLVDSRWDMDGLPMPRNRCCFWGLRDFDTQHPSPNPPTWRWRDIEELNVDRELPVSWMARDELPRPMRLTTGEPKSWGSSVVTGGFSYSRAMYDMAERVAKEYDLPPGAPFTPVLLPLIADGKFGAITDDSKPKSFRISAEPQAAGAHIARKFDRAERDILIESIYRNESGPRRESRPTRD